MIVFTVKICEVEPHKLTIGFAGKDIPGTMTAAERQAAKELTLCLQNHVEERLRRPNVISGDIISGGKDHPSANGDDLGSGQSV